MPINKKKLVLILLIILSIAQVSSALDSPNTRNVSGNQFFQYDYFTGTGSNELTWANMHQIKFYDIDSFERFYSIRYTTAYGTTCDAAKGCYGSYVNAFYQNTTANAGTQYATLTVGAQTIATGTLYYSVSGNTIYYGYYADSWTPGALTNTQTAVINANWSTWDVIFGNSGRYTRGSLNTSSWYSINFMTNSDGSSYVSQSNQYQTRSEFGIDWDIAYNRTQTGGLYDYFSIDKYFNGKHLNTFVSLATSQNYGVSWTEVINATDSDSIVNYPVPSTYTGHSQRLKLRSAYATAGTEQTFSWNSTTENCNFTAAVINMNSGNIIPESTFNMWDLTLGTSENFYLPSGIGEVSFPSTSLGHEFAWNATKSGFFDVYLVSGVIIENCSYIQDRDVYAVLSGSAADTSNATISFSVMEDSDFPLPISGANIQLILPSGTKQVKTTNSVGSAYFSNLLLNETYNWSVSKTNWYGKEGSEYTDSTLSNVVVKLSRGMVPTAQETPATTITPGVPHDTTTEALDFLKQNTLNLVMLFFLATIMGVLKLMTK